MLKYLLFNKINTSYHEYLNCYAPSIFFDFSIYFLENLYIFSLKIFTERSSWIILVGNIICLKIISHFLISLYLMNTLSASSF